MPLPDQPSPSENQSPGPVNRGRSGDSGSRLAQPDSLTELTERIARFQQQRWVRVLRRITLVMTVIFLILCLVPYLVPVSSAAAITEKPFADSAFRTVNGVQLHYRVWPASAGAVGGGPSASGNVLLVHGLGGSTVSWRENVAALQAAGFNTVAVDLPGFGFSSRQTGLDHSQASRASLVWALLDTLEAELPASRGGQPWHLVGHSMGGGTVTAMALAAPERTAGVVLVDGAVFGNAPAAAGLLFRFPPAARWLQVMLERILIEPERIASFLASAAGQPVPPERAAAYYRPLTVPGSARAFVDIVRTTRSEPVEGLDRLAMPVRAIWGEADTWVPVVQAEQIRQKVRRLEVAVIPGAAHTPMETHPDAFNALLVQMLRR